MDELIQESVSYSTVRRLPLYMPLLRAAMDAGELTISSAKIAELWALIRCLSEKI
jgi:NADH/NAD ratio-sensing transcriptional regulator Rex